MTAIASTVQAFFTERLAAQRRASPHTVAAYRDTLRLLLGFAAQRTGASPCRLDIGDLGAPVIAAFLDHLERERGNSIRSRNARLAAIHSLFAYAALRHPEHAADIAGSWRSRPSGPTRRSSRSSPIPRQPPCSPPRTGPPAPAAATTPGSCWPSRPGCGPPSSPP